jgi:hypothetical protein
MNLRFDNGSSVGSILVTRANIPNRQDQRDRSRLTFDKCWVRIPPVTPSILANVFRGFPQSLEANAGIVPRLDTYCFLSDP